MKLIPLTLLGFLSLSAAASAALTPVFSYKFPGSYAGETAVTNVVTDASAGAHPAKVYPKDGEANLVLSDEVPPGAPAGAKSLDLATVDGSIRTDAIKVLDRPTVFAANGFTMDVWFKGIPSATGTAFQKVMDDTGTDFIAVNGADNDADGKFGQIVARVGGGTGNTFYLDSDDGLVVDGWNHIIMAFAVTGGTDIAPTGDATLILNGVVRLYPARTLVTNATYTGYNRPVAIGKHPVNNSEYYTGLVYNPTLSLGTDPVAAPALVLASSGPDGFTVNIKDGSASAVLPASVVTKLNGATVTTDVSKAGDTTAVSYFPATTLPGGVYSVEVTFNDAAGPHTETRSFNVVGNAPAPVFAYRFPASNDGSGASLDVIDQSTGAHQAVLTGEVPLSEDVPPGQPAAARSLDLLNASGAIVTNETKLLDNTLVVAAGGFNMDVWFKGVPASGTAFQKIIDYAGTEFISVSGADTDNDGSFGQMVVRMSSGTYDIILDADDGLLTDDWNHFTYNYQVLNGADIANLIGTVTLTLNGRSTSYTNRPLTSYGDTLNRPIGIGRHPTATEYYRGLLFNPTVSLGSLSDTPPLVAVSASKAAGAATYTLTDGGGGAIVPASVVLKVDGAVVAPAVSGDGGLTTAVYTPLTAFASGRHTSVLTFTDGSGAKYYASAPFIIVGASYDPLFGYSFPDSYDGSTNSAPVTDLTGPGNNGTAIGTTTDLPVALSEDIPPGAVAGTKSLSYTNSPGTVATVKTKLLNRPSVTIAGGYTYDVWFKGVQGATIQKILDYAGTEYIGTKETNSDGDDNAGEVIISVSNSATFMVLDKDDGLDPAGWNHLVFSFKVTDETNPLSLGGEATANLNGTITTRSGNLSNYGDTLNRTLNVGSHPTAGVDLYRGLVYNPTVYLGVPPVAGGDTAISLTRSGNSLEITYSGVLQSSENLQTWADVQNATSPYTVALPSTGKLFFRARPASP